MAQGPRGAVAVLAAMAGGGAVADAPASAPAPQVSGEAGWSPQWGMRHSLDARRSPPGRSAAETWR